MLGGGYLEDHPTYLVVIDNSHFESHGKAIWKGNNPRNRGRKLIHLDARSTDPRSKPEYLIAQRSQLADGKVRWDSVPVNF